MGKVEASPLRLITGGYTPYKKDPTVTNSQMGSGLEGALGKCLLLDILARWLQPSSGSSQRPSSQGKILGVSPGTLAGDKSYQDP